jgi:hypothetical protein
MPWKMRVRDGFECADGRDSLRRADSTHRQRYLQTPAATPQCHMTNVASALASNTRKPPRSRLLGVALVARFS